MIRRLLPTLSTRTWLGILAAASLIPLLGALTYLLTAQYTREKEAAFSQLQSTSRALLQALDRELAAKAKIVQSFSVSRTFKDGDFERVYAQSHEILKSLALKGAIFLTDSNGKLLLHSDKPFGSELPTIVNREGVDWVIEKKEPYFTNYYVSRVTGTAEISVLVPVSFDSKVFYALGLTTPLSDLAEILKRQKMPTSFLISIVDRNQVILARTINSERFVGTRTNTAYTEAVASMPEGILENIRGAEGSTYLAAWVRSPLSGWTLGMSYDVNEFAAPIYQKMKLAALISLIAIALSFSVAWVVAQRFDSGTLLLQKAADAMRAEEAVSQSPTGILEYDTILSDFADASSLLRARVEDRQRAEQALRESEARKSAILESALDAIIAMDQEGRVVDFNPGAEKLFGYRREDVLGRTVADTIIPERFREAHWRGLRRFLEIGQGSVLDRRIEMPAVRSDGSEFASELAIAVATLNNNQLIFTAYLRDITEQKRAAETEKVLTRELEHRTNNLLSVIDGIAQRSFSGNHTLEEARANFSARLRSLAQTQRELTKANWTGLSLIDIVRSKLEPVAARAKIEGVDVLLDAKNAQSLSLALHELMTNAVKYGALSDPSGEITISWAITGEGTDRLLKFKWQERGGPPVVAPKRVGFGTSLLKATLGEARVEWAEEGLIYDAQVQLGTPAAAG